ncbi:NAD-dependent epimerase/dehydratase family protein [Bacillus zanthoxyli]|nr:NAD-dependent epimerase/dehydratase family protein [Bacillus zanthoxyli]
MNILVTGADGFIGKNLIAELKSKGKFEILKVTRNTTEKELSEMCAKTNFVFHLAGINRPKNEEEFYKGNRDFTSKLLLTLKKHNNHSPIVVASSIQASLDNPYGESKRMGENIVKEHALSTKSKALIYRLPNVFGKWTKPNYNSVVATFCHNISHDIPITVNDPSVELNLVYIDDVVNEFVRAIDDQENRKDEYYCEISIVHKILLGKLIEILQSFKKSREDRSIPTLDDPLVKKLYSTYLSYLPTDKFSYELTMHKDNRGSFTEFIKTEDRGQVSINISKPGITKGNHWHHTKNEKFLVVSGQGVIRFRKIDSEEVIEYLVSGEKMEVVDIPIGYTHNIENLGDTDMVTVMWANELFNPEKPDTYYLEV